MLTRRDKTTVGAMMVFAVVANVAWLVVLAIALRWVISGKLPW